MKTRTMLLAVAFCLSAVAASFASDANLGTWKLNESKSKIAAGSSKNLTVVYTAEGDNYKCVVDGVDGAGHVVGDFGSTGIRPRLMDRLERAGAVPSRPAGRWS